MSLSKQIVAILLSSGLWFLSSCQPETRLTNIDNPPIADPLKLLYWQSPTLLNPHLSTGSKDFEASRFVYEPLASFNQAGDLVLFLADEVPSLEHGTISADFRSVTWRLKSGLSWSDGEPFTADDVVFTYTYVTHPEVGAVTAADYDNIQTIEAIDSTTVKITFKEPTAAWFIPFVGTNGMILPRHIFEAYTGANAREADANLKPIGTGPYQVVEFKPGDLVVYEANPNFRDPSKPAIPQIELKGGGDAPSAARAVLQTGDADYAWNIQVEAPILKELEARGQGRIVPKPGSNVEVIQINFSDPTTEIEGERSHKDVPHPFLSDLKVRQALTLAIDRDTIAEQLYGKAGTPTANLLVSPESIQSSVTPTYDPEQAAQLLDEANWVDNDGNGIRDQNGLELKLLFQSSANPVRQKTQEIIKQNLEAIGFDVELKSTEASIFFDSEPANTNNISHFYADLQMFTIGNNSPDPTAFMRGYLCEEIAQQSNNWSTVNFSRYCNPVYDALYQEVIDETDPDQRHQLFIQMNDLLVKDEVAVLPLIHRFSPIAVSHRLQGIDPTPWDLGPWNSQDWTFASN